MYKSISLKSGIIFSFITLCLLIVNSSTAQFKRYEPSKDEIAQMIKEIPTREDKIFYDGVVQCDTALVREKLFIKLRQWFVENFAESKAVLEVNDIDNGLLTGKGIYKYANINGLNLHSGYTEFIINIAVKDGKFRYQLYDFVAHNENQSMLMSTKTYEDKIELSNIFTMYKEGKREKYARKFLEDMVALVYKINHSLAEIKNTKSIQEF